MVKRWLIPLLAVGALGWAFVYVFVLTNKPVPPAAPVVEPTKPEFENYIAAAGIVESATENLQIGTNLPGIVTKLYVQEGDKVKADDPLFTIDDRDARANLQSAEARAAAAVSQIAEARAQLADAQSQWQKVKNIADPRAFSKDELDRLQYAVQTAEARVNSAAASAKSARADAEQARVTLERLTVHAPVDAEVLNVNIHLGEYAQAGALAKPLMLLGDTETLHIRADIDENDAWRYVPGAKAHATLRGNPEQKTDLTFVRVQPYVTPKQSLTGTSTERVDTRVLQVLYSFPRTALPAYVGQQMDVFIDAAPLEKQK